MANDKSDRRDNSISIAISALTAQVSIMQKDLAVNTNETQNIKDNVSEMKTDLKDIKSAFVTQQEFDTTIKELKEIIKPLKQFIYGIIGAMGLAVLGALLQQVLKK